MSEKFAAWIAARIPTYIAGRKEDLQSLHFALEGNDLKRISDLAHKMKGTGSSYGFAEITDIGARMEAAAKAGSRREIAACISALSDCLERIPPVPGQAGDCMGTQATSDLKIRTTQNGSKFERT